MKLQLEVEVAVEVALEVATSTSLCNFNEVATSLLQLHCATSSATQVVTSVEVALEVEVAVEFALEVATMKLQLHLSCTT